MGHSDDIEKLIQRVRSLISFGLSVEEIVETCKDSLDPGMTVGEVYLAWHAATILQTAHEKREPAQDANRGGAR